MVFCNAVAIGSNILQITQAQVYVFVLTVFLYTYFAFTSLIVFVELCIFLCYEVIVLKFRKRVLTPLFNFCPPFCLSELKVGAVNNFQFHRFALNFTFLRQLQKFTRAHWLNFIVKMQTDT